jgi:hypothetical protein
LIQNLRKKSNAPPMPDPPPLWGLTLIGALEWAKVNVTYACSVDVVMKVISGGGVHLPSKFGHAPRTNIS